MADWSPLPRRRCATRGHTRGRCSRRLHKILRQKETERVAVRTAKYFAAESNSSRRPTGDQIWPFASLRRPLRHSGCSMTNSAHRTSAPPRAHYFEGDSNEHHPHNIDQRLKDSVAYQLEWDPQLDASLPRLRQEASSRSPDTSTATRQARRRAREPAGIRRQSRRQRDRVRLASERIDPEIAKDALAALTNRVDVPLGITVTVRDGHITLGGTGRVDVSENGGGTSREVPARCAWRLQPHSAQAKSLPKDVEKRITAALHRHADIDARRIYVSAEGGTVVLGGSVRSWIEKDEAQRAAWRHPASCPVDNRISVVP